MYVNRVSDIQSAGLRSAGWAKIFMTPTAFGPVMDTVKDIARWTMIYSVFAQARWRHLFCNKSVQQKLMFYSLISGLSS